VGEAPNGVGVAVLTAGNVSVAVTSVSTVGLAVAVDSIGAVAGASFGVLTICGTVGKGRGVRVGGGSKFKLLCGLKKINVL
jgi:hypothetical protein